MIPVNFNQFYLEFKDVLDNPRPWMHARFGDGEGIVMGYPEFTGKKAAKARWHKWLGHSNLDMRYFALNIREAVKRCDIVGTPCLRHMKVNQDWRNVKHFMNKFGLLEAMTKTCCMDCTVELFTKGFLKELLNGRDEIYCISCRDVSSLLEKSFNIGYVETFPLPPQHKPFKGEILIDEPHFPDLFNKVPRWLDSLGLESHKLVLIGAGGLGKIYCSLVKDRGGIALDVGSLFDGWVGLITRSYLKNIPKFKL